MIDYNSEINQEIKREFVQKEVFVNITSLANCEINRVYNGEGSELIDEEDLYKTVYNLDTPLFYLEELTAKETDELTSELSEDLKTVQKFDNLESIKGLKCEHVINNLIAYESISDLMGVISESLENIKETPGDSIPLEYYEVFAVSDYLANKLIEKGETVLDFGNLWGWCRSVFGQSVHLDNVISVICEDLGLLKTKEEEETAVK